MLLFVTTPEQFDVKYSINPWMKEVLKKSISDVVVNKEVAKKQHEQFLQLLRKHTSVNVIPVNGLDTSGKLPDIIYTANSALFLPNLPIPVTIISRMLRVHRQPEEAAWSSYMHSLPIRTIKFPSKSGAYFEGEGDVVFTPDLQKMFCGYGIRSTKKGTSLLKVIIEDEYRKQTSIEKKPEFYQIKLINSKYFHIDLCFRPLANNCALIRRNSIAPKSIKLIETLYDADRLINVDDSEPFTCNGLVVNNYYLCSNSISAKTIKSIEELSKMKVETVPLTEFEKGGGSLKCMILTVQ
jgi:N-dimethylarginine dimethylaminohydrolase